MLAAGKPEGMDEHWWMYESARVNLYLAAQEFVELASSATSPAIRYRCSVLAAQTSSRFGIRRDAETGRHMLEGEVFDPFSRNYPWQPKGKTEDMQD